MPDLLFAGRAFAALLFDMDGTLLSSKQSAERIWSAWAARHGLDVERFLPTIHGVRSLDTIRRLAIPGLDPEDEAAAITAAEIVDTDGVHPIPGAARFLDALPWQRWAIVTSAPRELAAARLAAAGLAQPPVLLAAEDVTIGKPNPACYRHAAERLGFDARDCLVFEDAEAGIAAAEAAGARLVVIGAAGGRRASAHPRVADFASLAPVVGDTGRIAVRTGAGAG